MPLNHAISCSQGRHSRDLPVALLLFWGAIIVAAGPPAPGAQISEQSRISVTTDLVVLPVSVLDSQGTFVSGLGRQNFRVHEDGRLQKITLFAEEDVPVTVGLIVDHSRSMGPKLNGVATAVSEFAHSSNPQDEMFVVDFSDRVSIERIHGKAFTNDGGELEQAISAVSARGQTALYDAVMEALKHLQLGQRDKKALLIVSDGGDNASRHKFAEVLELAQRSHAIIYSIGLVGTSEEEENPKVLEKLCRETGGVAFFPRPGESITDISRKIARDLREQYTLGYSPEKTGGRETFRKIKVEISAPGRGKFHVRTRSGYFPSSGKELSAQPGRSAP